MARNRRPGPNTSCSMSITRTARSARTAAYPPISWAGSTGMSRRASRRGAGPRYQRKVRHAAAAHRAHGAVDDDAKQQARDTRRANEKRASRKLARRCDCCAACSGGRAAASGSRPIRRRAGSIERRLHPVAALLQRARSAALPDESTMRGRRRRVRGEARGTSDDSAMRSAGATCAWIRRAPPA